MKTKFISIIGVDPSNASGVVSLASTVTAALALNVGTYATPNPAISIINAQKLIVQGFIDQVSGGDHAKIGLRDEASLALYLLLQNELYYVNTTANFDKAKLMLSGFKIIKESAAQPVPGQVVIKRVEDTAEAHKAKIFIQPLGLKRLRFYVQTTTTPDVENSWVTKLEITDSRKLILENLVYGQVFYIRVKASNTRGIGLNSEPKSFISQN